LEGRTFQRAVRELSERLVTVTKEDDAGSRVAVLECLESALPRTLKTRSESVSEKEACARLMAATMNSCVMTHEVNLKRWFPWCRLDSREILDMMVRNRDCVRVQTQEGAWVVSRKALEVKKMASR
jgi:hypothetical protein